MELSIGTRVKATRDIEQGGVYIARGSRGTVRALEPEMDGVDVAWDQGDMTFLVQDERTITRSRSFRPRNCQPLWTGAAFVVIFCIGWMLPPPDFTANADQPIQIEGSSLGSTTVKLGEALQVIVKFHQHLKCNGVMERRFLQVGVPLAEVTSYVMPFVNLLHTDGEPRTFLVPVPKSLRPGRYIYRAVAVVKCGGSEHHYVVDTVRPLEFDLVEG